jgi:hypothetical protein
VKPRLPGQGFAICWPLLFYLSEDLANSIIIGLIFIFYTISYSLFPGIQDPVFLQVSITPSSSYRSFREREFRSMWCLFIALYALYAIFALYWVVVAIAALRFSRKMQQVPSSRPVSMANPEQGKLTNFSLCSSSSPSCQLSLSVFTWLSGAVWDCWAAPGRAASCPCQHLYLRV